MQRICFLLRVTKIGLLSISSPTKTSGRKCARASRHGWHNYSLFLNEDGLLVGYFETPDFDAAIEGMQHEPINERWQTLMKPFFASLDSDTADKSMRPLEAVFYLA